MAKRSAAASSLQSEKKSRSGLVEPEEFHSLVEDEVESLTRQWKDLQLEGPPCAFCAKPHSCWWSWNCWVLIGPTDAPVELLKSHFCCSLTTNQQSFYQGKSGYYLLACAECMESYRESFLLVAAASAPKDLPAQYVELRSLQDANAFTAFRCMARLLANQLYHKLQHIAEPG